MTTKGLYCPAGNFYIDPTHAVENAIITHAHSDHARRGSQQYYCTTSGVELLKTRLGNQISVLSFPYGEQFRINEVDISFHPAGHILGSSQIRVELFGEVWVVSGDYKLDPDPTCEPFETIKCDVFITEATFGTPTYSWNKTIDFGQAILTWWHKNMELGLNSVLLAYSLGKAQRILGLLSDIATKPIFCHPAIEALNQCYRQQAIALASTSCLSSLEESHILQNELIIAPPTFLKTKQAMILGNYKTAFASGWMAKKSDYYDEGFVMSDHADWNDLLSAIEKTCAKRVYVQHRAGALIRELKTRGIKAFPDSALFPKNPDQLRLF